MVRDIMARPHHSSAAVSLHSSKLPPHCRGVLCAWGRACTGPAPPGALCAGARQRRVAGARSATWDRDSPGTGQERRRKVGGSLLCTVGVLARQECTAGSGAQWGGKVGKACRGHTHAREFTGVMPLGMLRGLCLEAAGISLRALSCPFTPSSALGEGSRQPGQGRGQQGRGPSHGTGGGQPRAQAGRVH